MLESHVRANRQMREVSLDRLTVGQKGQRDATAAEMEKKADDLFYSPSNVAHLMRGISALNHGKGTEHELIEAEEE